MTSTTKVNVFWFRRDLRLHDNVGLKKALQGKHPLLLLFIFDEDIIDQLPVDDARITFIFDTVQKMRETLQNNYGSTIALYHGKPLDVFKKISELYDLQNVITNRDYEPYALARDAKINTYLAQKNIGFYTFKDQVIFEKNEIIKTDGTPYLVFTPYMRTWKKQFFATKTSLASAPENFTNCLKQTQLPNLSLKDIGFLRSKIEVPKYQITNSIIQNYENTRNFPALNGTSYLGAHLRFGTVSVRQIVQKAISQKNETFLNEIIWRAFFMQLLYHFPETQHQAFKKKYDRIGWRNDKTEFEKWKTGQTGYPLVDAGMRQLNTTGWMHNRVRMLVGSFLCKHLLIDWRWGEAYFAEKLLDYEMASNIGNWQWVAGCGADAAPYFRIFNPTTQIEKFDKERVYIKKWVPEYNTPSYPQEIVNHQAARQRALLVYKEAVTI